MLQLPDFFLKRPNAAGDYTADFEKLFTKFVANGNGQEIPYDVAAPKWQFLCYLCDTKNVVMHGSANPDISEFEPRQANDIEEFGNRKAVYAAADGIWPMYFAIVDRKRVSLLMNACFRFLENGKPEPYYFFSVDEDALPNYPWHNGTVYILPRDTFEQQATREYQGLKIESTQWASLVAVKPLAKLTVTPEDFPFLTQMNGHNPQIIAERSATNPDGFPWRD